MPALTEFQLIERYFTEAFRSQAEQVLVGVGDDCAVLQLAPGEQLATSVDTMVAGCHFLPDIPPRYLAWRVLAAAASDLAACGARPLGFTLSLTLTEPEEHWLAAFAAGLAQAAESFALPLVGGDTTSGPLALSVQVLGAVPAGEALLRSGARAGDDIWVSGTLGDARAALDFLAAEKPEGGDFFLQRYYQPEPRLALGQALLGLASAAVDISDGLAADLGHILKASGVAGELQWSALPLSAALKNYGGELQARQYALAGGDDYELCFTAGVDQRQAIDALAQRGQPLLTRIGCILPGAGLRCLDDKGQAVSIGHGYEHFGHRDE